MAISCRRGHPWFPKLNMVMFTCLGFLSSSLYLSQLMPWYNGWICPCACVLIRTDTHIYTASADRYQYPYTYMTMIYVLLLAMCSIFTLYSSHTQYIYMDCIYIKYIYIYLNKLKKQYMYILRSILYVTICTTFPQAQPQASTSRWASLPACKPRPNRRHPGSSQSDGL